MAMKSLEVRWVLALAVLALSTLVETPSAKPQVEDSPRREAGAPAVVAATQSATQPAAPVPPGEEEVSLAFKDMGMDQIARFLADKTHKVVIPMEPVKQIKLTIVSSEKMKLSEAMLVLREALRQSGAILEEGPRVITIRATSDARQSNNPVLQPDEPLSKIADKSRIVDKIFQIKHYDTVKLKDVVLPFLPSYGYIVADPNTRRLVVTAPVSSLERIEKLIGSLDVATFDQTVKKFIEIKHGDATEIAGILRTLIGSTLSKDAGSSSTPGAPGGAPRQPSPDGSIGDSISIIPDPTRNWIIAIAPAPAMKQIEAWIEELDTAMDPSRANNLATKVFEIKHGDAEQVRINIEDLFAPPQQQGFNPYYYGGRQPRAPGGNEKFKVTADARRNTVTVMADPVTIARVAKLIEEDWDAPLAQAEAQPKIYVLQHADPVRMKDLLTELFTKKEEAFDYRRLFFGGAPQERQTEAVGRLYGQFTIETMPDSNRLVVVAKNANNYVVIDNLIKELDQPEDAGVPQAIELKHANAEELAEQLNASMSEPGTLAEILRSERDLTSTARSRGLASSERSAAGGAAAGADGAQPQQAAAPGVMRFWWQTSRPRTDERPMSNLIGKIRFVPINRRNAILILAPKAYMSPILALVEEMDRPGMQVIIHAVIAEVQHNDQTTVGMRFASDPAILSDPRLGDMAIGGSTDFTHNQLYGGTFAIGGATFGSNVVRTNINVNVLLQLLMRKFNTKILFEPKLYTADNQQAEFFDGQDVPFQTNSQTSAEGTSISRSFDYTAVGTRLSIRPHITREGDVDLRVNLELSNIVPGETTLGNFLFDRRETTTHVVIHDGQTVMLSGIVRTEDYNDVRKIPLLGDLPGIGGAFRNTDKAKRNRELIAFITPIVVRSEVADSAKAMDPYVKSLQRLKNAMDVPATLPATQPARNEGMNKGMEKQTEGEQKGNDKGKEEKED